MARFLYDIFSWDQRKCRITFLAFLWFVGLLFGIRSLAYTGDVFLLMLRMALAHPGSLLRSLFVSWLPLVLSLIAIAMDLPWLYQSICVVKAWLFGLISAACLTAFGSAGWLIGVIALFREALSQALLWWLLICHIPQGQPIRWRQVCFCFAAVTWIVCMDCYVISPFLVTLIEI